MSTPLFSRLPNVSPFGKLDDILPETRCSHELRLHLQRFASLEEKGLGTYIREVLEHHTLLEERRLRRIVDKFGGDMEGTNV